MHVISKNITYKEATKSRTAVKYGYLNKPNSIQLAAMKLVANKVFQPVREYLGVAIAVTSFFRSLKVNKKVGGSKTSSHVKGEAIDLDADVYGKATNAEIFYFILENLEFDQLIWEFGDSDEPAWVHVSYRKDNNRKQALIAYKGEKNRITGKKPTKYISFSESNLKKVF